MLENAAYLRSSKGKHTSCLCPQLLHLSVSSLAAALDFATLLLLLCFPLSYGVMVPKNELLRGQTMEFLKVCMP